MMKKTKERNDDEKHIELVVVFFFGGEDWKWVRVIRVILCVFHFICVGF